MRIRLPTGVRPGRYCRAYSAGPRYRRRHLPATTAASSTAATSTASAASGEKLVLRGVHFDFNKAIIRPGDAAVLDEAITTLKANPGVVIDVNGYCDAIGSVEYNLELSRSRGNAVANYLLNGGIQATQLRVHGYGKTNFVATNRTAEGRAQNRRVELVPKSKPAPNLKRLIPAAVPSRAAAVSFRQRSSSDADAGAHFCYRNLRYEVHYEL